MAKMTDNVANGPTMTERMRHMLEIAGGPISSGTIRLIRSPPPVPEIPDCREMSFGDAVKALDEALAPSVEPSFLSEEMVRQAGEGMGLIKELINLGVFSSMSFSEQLRVADQIALSHGTARVLPPRVLPYMVPFGKMAPVVRLNELTLEEIRSAVRTFHLAKIDAPDGFLVKVSPEDSDLMWDLPNFVPTTFYGRMAPLPNEVGSIENVRFVEEDET